MAHSDGARKKKSKDILFSKTVILLKNDDQASLSFSELSRIRSTSQQYKKGIEFGSRMTEDDVTKKIKETFPYLENKRFSCAAVVKLDHDHKKYEFHGSPRVWNGETIRKKIMGNSSLYILEEVSQQTSTVTNNGSNISAANLMPRFHGVHPTGGQTCTINTPLDSNQAVLYQQLDQLNSEFQMSHLGDHSPMEVDDDNQQGVSDYMYTAGNYGILHTYGAPNSMQNPVSLIAPASSEQGHSFALSLGEGNVTATSQQGLNITPASSTDSTGVTVATAPGAQVELSGKYSSSSEDNFPTSGISEGDFVLSEDDLSQNHWRREANVQLQVSITPSRVPLKGGELCNFTFTPMLPKNVQSGSAEFENLETVVVKRFEDDSMIGKKIPPSPEPGWVTVVLKSQYGVKLGETRVDYVDEEKEFFQRVVQEPKLQHRLFSEWSTMLGDNLEPKKPETQSSGNLGSTQMQKVQVLHPLVYAAAETGAQQFIEMIFSSSAGRVIFDAYKDSSPLPEVIARKHGHKETSQYLEGITTRFSKEMKICPEGSQTIDLAELAAAAEAAQEQQKLSISNREENHQVDSDETIDTGYCGDAETSSTSARSDGDSEISLEAVTVERNVVQGDGKLHVVEPLQQVHCSPVNVDHEAVVGNHRVRLKSIRGSVLVEGDEEFQWTIDSFIKYQDRFIQEINMSFGLCMEQREQFILHTLKYLEESWGRCASSKTEVYKILGKISCSVNSDIAVRHALRLLFHLICKDNFCNGNRSLLEVEAILRSAIFPSKGMFKKDQHSEQSLKLIVYSRVLALLLVQQVQQEKLPNAALEQDLKKVQKELRRCCAKVKNQKKDVFRYSMEFILQTICHLLKPHDKLITSTKISRYLEECQAFCLNHEKESKNLKVIDTFGKKKSGEWSVLHCILIYLHGKVRSECPVPQMKTNKRAMILFRLIVEAYLQGGGGADWRFCLLVSSLLADIAKNNATEEIIKEAGCCLVYVLQDKKVQKRPECRTLLERRSSELLFCPDRKTRNLLVHFLSENQHLQDTLPADLHTDHLTSMYRTQTLEIDTEPISYGQACFVQQGMFQGRKVAVKILFVKRQHLVEKNLKFQSGERLIREAYNLIRLNASQHRNLPVLLGYDIENLPYHIITAYEICGNLLHFVRKSRKSIHHIQPIQLLKMLIDISDALLHLEGLNLVHRAIMAENVLVGDSYVCKLSGLHALKQLTFGTSKRASASLYDYCSADDGAPAFVSTDNDEKDEQLPLRWKAPECLAEHWYSTASDVWAFGVLMYEVLTYGCIPYRHVLDDDKIPSLVLNRKETVPHELCFEDEEYRLIKQSCEWQIPKRISLSDVNNRLKELIKNADEAQMKPHDPPPLEMLQNIAGSCNFEDHDKEEPIYSSIADNEEYNSRNGDCPFTKTVKGLPVICERIAGVDYQHLKALARLNNSNLASILIQHCCSHCWRVEIISPASPFGNLKEYVLNRRCQQGDLVTFLSQISSALHYLHTRNIVHGDLRAMYVNVAAPDKVQVGRLGRSKSLLMSGYDVTSTSCVAEADMPCDGIRWSAPEVILDGRYTHASDVWAFGILAWELYTSFTTGQDRRPYYHLQDDEILCHMRQKGPLDPPEGCPDWVYILMHQCWAYESVQRPPFLAIFDCLTSREPMESWIMTLWLQNHKEDEWPDLSIRQTDACHVTDAEKHPSRENIQKMCSTDFFIKHNYTYVSCDEATTSYGRSERKNNSLPGKMKERNCEEEPDDYDDVIGFFYTEDNRRLVEFSTDSSLNTKNMADALNGDDNTIYDDVICFPTNGDDDVYNVIKEDNVHLGNHQNMEQHDNMMYQ